MVEKDAKSGDLLKELRAARERIAELEERLAESGRLPGEAYKAAFQAAPDAIYVVDESFRFVEVNPAACGLLGYDRQELLRRGPLEIHSPGDIPAMRERRRQLEAAGEVRFQATQLRKDKTEVPVEIFARSFSLPGLRGHVSVARDRSRQVQAEESLRRSEEFNRAIIESTSDCVKVIDDQARLRFINGGGLRLLGLKGEGDVLGRRYPELWPEEVRADVEEVVSRTLGGENSFYKGKLAASDGRTRYWDIAMSPMRKADGRVSGAVIVSRDVTERKLAEETLLDSHRFFRTVFEESLLPMLILEIETGAVVEANKAAAHFYARDRAVLDRLTIFDLSLLPRRNIVQKLKKASAQGGTRYQSRHRLADGTIRDVEVLTGPIVFKGRSLSLFMVQDVTERHRSRRELERRQRVDASLAALARKLLNAEDIANASEALLDAACALTGAACGFAGTLEFPGGPLGIKAMRGDPRGRTRSADIRLEIAPAGGLLGRAIDAGEPLLVNDPAAVRREGGLPAGHSPIENFLGAPALLDAIPAGLIALANAPNGFDANDPGVLSRLADLFALAIQRMRREEDLRAAKAEAEKANAAKSEFLARMSHEIRTPMNAVLNLTDEALALARDAEQADYLRTSKEAAEHLLAIINDILDLSRIEAGRLDLERIDFDLGEVLRAVVGTLAPQARAKGLELRLEIAGGLPGRVLGDPERLRQVLVNLAGNAVKFTDAGEVVVRACPETAPTSGAPGKPSREGTVTALFSVKDTGPGVEPEKRSRLFERFSQGDGSTTRRHGGAGLGLAISKELVELMGGTIWFESREPRGSAFSFRLPLAPAAPAPDRRDARDAASPAAPLKGLRILLAEDNEQNVKVARALLKRYGHQVDVAGTGREVLAMLVRKRYDVVLMDLEMPEMDGLEAARRVRAGEAGEENAGLPIIAMTAHAIQGYREKSLEAGMDEYLAKPVSAKRLESALRESQLTSRPAARPAGATDLAETGAAAPVLDQAAALERFDYDEALYLEFCGEFRRAARKKLLQMAEFLEKRDENLYIFAHAMKGGAGIVGGAAVAEAAHELEKISRVLDWDGASRALAVLEERVEELCAALDRRLAQ